MMFPTNVGMWFILMNRPQNQEDMDRPAHQRAGDA